MGGCAAEYTRNTHPVCTAGQTQAVYSALIKTQTLIEESDSATGADELKSSE